MNPDKWRKKSFCGDCRALQGEPYNTFCALGYVIKQVKKRNGDVWWWSSIPLEKCPKPTTYRQWTNAPHRDEIPAQNSVNATKHKHNNGKI